MTISHPFDFDFDVARWVEKHPRPRGDRQSGYESFIGRAGQAEASEFHSFDSNPRVTVVVPSYNSAPYLEWTLDSVQNQTFADFECIIVDDASTDKKSLELAKARCAKDDRFRLVQHRSNGGLPAARNTGLRSARTSLICFLDSDDLMMPTSLENRARLLRSVAHQRLAGSYSGSLRIEEHVRVPPRESAKDDMKPVDFVSAKGMCPFNANQPMFRTSVLRTLGGFDERLKQAEDWEFWIRLLRHGYHMQPTGLTDVTYRARPDSMVRSDPMRHLETSLEIYESVHQPLPEWKTFSGTPFVFRKPWLEYRKQMDLAGRVLQFSGMAIGTARSVDRTLEYATNTLPDLIPVISAHHDLASHLAGGLRRLSTGPTAERSLRYNARMLATQLSSFADSRGDVNYEPPAIPDAFPDLGPSAGEHRRADIVFLPHKDYHVWSFYSLLPALDEAGISYVFVDPKYSYRDEGARRKLEELGLPWVPYNTFALGEYQPKMVVCMNDWELFNKRIAESARALGIASVGIVEGIQDYLDMDTGRKRGPYRNVEYVILPGPFDARYFPDDPKHVRVGGVPRVDDLLGEEPQFPSDPLVVINSNFTYNVLVDKRDAWVKTAVAACREAGYDYIISKHPAEQGDFSRYKVGDESMYDLIRRGSVFVSRFGSGILEALAMGKPSIYYNPHRERVDKFKEPAGAFPIATTQSELVAALKATVNKPETFLANADPYLELHCGTSHASRGRAGTRVTQELLEIYRSHEYGPDWKRARLGALVCHRDGQTLGPPPKPRPKSALRATTGANGAAKRPSHKGTAMERKLRKLRKDPRLFFEDSKLGPLRALRHLF